MDGLNLNLAFEKHLQSHFLTQNATFLNIGTCPFHTIHKGFSKSVREIGFDIEQIIIDINAFFKLSSAHRENYSKLEEITELPLQTFL